MATSPGPAVSTVLDEAFERMASSSAFELPNGFVNHGPMGCEALAAMGLDDEVDGWARRFERVPGPAVTPVPAPRLDWADALGDYRRLPEWIGHLQLAVDAEGWRNVVATWVPRLAPGLAAKLYHVVIRTAHATRALTVADTPARRAELARALGYWAARFAQGQAVTGADEPAGEDLHAEVAAAAESAARCYLAAPSIVHLHGVTSAMSLDLLVDHLPPAAGRATLAQLRADHAALFRATLDGDTEPEGDAPAAGVPMGELAADAARSGDVHQVKLVEACRRGLARTGSSTFAAAAETVTGRRGG